MPFAVSLLQIDNADARSLAEIKRRRTCCTLSIFSSGMDAARVSQKRCFGFCRNSQPKVYTDVHFWRRCAVYLQKSCYNLDRGIISGAVFSPSIAENSLSSFLPFEDIRVGIFMMTLR